MLDSYWLDAIQFLANHLTEDDVVLAPNGFTNHLQGNAISHYRTTFLGLTDQFFSLIVLHKGMLRRIQPDFLSAVDKRFVPVFVNEVFVILARSPHRFDPIPPDSPHLQAYQNAREAMHRQSRSSGESLLSLDCSSPASRPDDGAPSLPRREFVPNIDVLLCSYRKCGRTWLRFILSCYINERCGLGHPPSRDTMGILVPSFKVMDEVPLDTICTHHYAGKHGLRAIAASHQNYSNPNAPKILAPKDIIFLFRSVGDVLVSQYFERVFRRDFHPRESVWAFIQDERLLEAYVEYLNAWADNLEHHRHMTLTYEELRRDTAGAVSKVLTFIGTDVDVTVLEHAITLSSFENMQKMERKELGLAERSDETASLRTRRGKIGGYRDYLSDEAVSAIRQYCGDRLSPKAKELFDRHHLDR